MHIINSINYLTEWIASRFEAIANRVSVRKASAFGQNFCEEANHRMWFVSHSIKWRSSQWRSHIGECNSCFQLYYLSLSAAGDHVWALSSLTTGNSGICGRERYQWAATVSTNVHAIYLYWIESFVALTYPDTQCHSIRLEPLWSGRINVDLLMQRRTPSVIDRLHDAPFVLLIAVIVIE